MPEVPLPQPPVSSQMPPSFIPRQGQDDGLPKRKEHIGLFSLLSIVLLLATVIVWGSYWWYSNEVLENTIATLEADIEASQDKIDESVIDELVTMDTRIELTKDLVGSHIALRPLLELIADNTLTRTIRYPSFTYALSKSESGLEPVVSLAGRADELSSLAFQEIVYEEEESIRDLTITSIAKAEEENEVSFVTTFSVDPNLVLFEKVIEVNRNDI